MIQKLSLLLYVVILLLTMNTTNPYQHAIDKPGKALSLIYEYRLTYPLRLVARSRVVSALAGWYTRCPISARHIDSFIASNSIDMTEAVLEKSNNYATFHDFFIRKLKPTARPIDQDTRSIVSPADGAIIGINDLSLEPEFMVKRRSFNLTQFLGCPKLADEYKDGSLVMIYLGPWDYHRFHFPVAGSACTAKTIPGVFESVHPYIYRLGIQPLLENERHITIIRPERAPTSPIACVSVGALAVGKITETYLPETFYTKGAELGYFSFGGSTVVLLFKKGAITLAKNLSLEPTTIKMGQQIGYFTTA
jgi:phosphatidylserine decarboxylase